MLLTFVYQSLRYITAASSKSDFVYVCVLCVLLLYASGKTGVIFMLCDVFQDVFTVNHGVVKGLDLTGVEQLTDAFFVMIQLLHQDSPFCRNLDSLSLVGCTHLTDLSVVYITKLFPNLRKAILSIFLHIWFSCLFPDTLYEAFSFSSLSA